jgi:hypothetical protein
MFPAIGPNIYRLEYPILVIATEVLDELSTCKSPAGEVVFIPTLPFAATLKRTVLVEEATRNKSSVGFVEVPCTTKDAVGELEAIPIL